MIIIGSLHLEIVNNLKGVEADHVKPTKENVFTT